jgi:hypothetical protein
MAAAALVLSACSFSSEENTAVADILDRTRAEGSARIRSHLSYTSGAGAGITGYGSFDLRDGRGAIAFREELGTQDVVVDRDLLYWRVDDQSWVRVARPRKECSHLNPVAVLAALDSARDVERVRPGDYTGLVCDDTFRLLTDGEGRVRQIRFHDVTGNKIKLDFMRFGVPVGVEPPARSLTPQEQQDLLERQQREKCKDPKPADEAECALYGLFSE